MRKVAVIGFAMITFAATALPALADHQSISLVTGMIGGRAWDAPRAPAQSPKYIAARRTTPTRYSDYAQYNDAPYGGSADSGYALWRCTYTGGPKNGAGWTCP
jgi:hypothetical protein